MNVFCGVPAWADGTGDDATLHFGEVQNADTKYANDADIFKPKFNFFTYDPTPDGMGTFRWPFFTDDKVGGVLSNMWAGCEPVCEIVSRLLGGGFFFGLPWNKGVGYTFRPNVPKLVFVFSNEFDNSLSRIMLIEDEEWHYENVEVLALPTIYAKWVNTDMKVTEKKIYKDSFTCFVNIRGELNEQQTPPDPYCMQMTKVDKLDMEAFLNKINITAE